MEKLRKKEDYIYNSIEIDKIQRRKMDIKAIEKHLNNLEKNELTRYLSQYIYRERMEKKVNRVRISEEQFKEYFEIKD